MKTITLTTKICPIEITLLGIEQTGAVVVISNSVSTTQKFYFPFAEYLSHCGMTVLCFDHFGMGKSCPESMKSLKEFNISRA